MSNSWNRCYDWRHTDMHQRRHRIIAPSTYQTNLGGKRTKQKHLTRLKCICLNTNWLQRDHIWYDQESGNRINMSPYHWYDINMKLKWDSPYVVRIRQNWWSKLSTSEQQSRFWLHISRSHCTTAARPFCPPAQTITAIFEGESTLNHDRHFADNLFKCIFTNDKFCTLIQISQKFVPTGPFE